MNKIALASNNIGKIKEFKNIFANLNIDIIPQTELNIPDVDEPYFTFIENSLYKARHCAKYSGLPSLADDSGICVNSLNGHPGVHSARYSGSPKSDSRNNKRLIADLASFNNKSAYFYCILVLVRFEFDPQPLISDGIIYGEIIDTPRGNNGFGYDPHFYLPHLHKTVAELTSEEKNKISHRKMAANNLLIKLKDIDHATSI